MAEVVLLSRSEAEELVQLAQEAGEKFSAYVLRLHEGEAWRVLGYKSWTAFVDEGFYEETAVFSVAGKRYLVPIERRVWRNA